jgi:hypothetical protein
MKQGRILLDSLPGLEGRFDSLSGSLSNDASPAAGGQTRGTSATGQGAKMQGGAPGMASQAAPSAPGSWTQPLGKADASGQVGRASSSAIQRQTSSTAPNSQALSARGPRIGTRIASRIQALAGRLSSLAYRLGVPTATAVASETGAANVTSGLSEAGAVNQAAAAGSAEANSPSPEGAVEDFGTVTISLSQDGSSLPASPLLLEPRVINWLERLAHVLKMKLAAMS